MLDISIEKIVGFYISFFFLLVFLCYFYITTAASAVSKMVMED